MADFVQTMKDWRRMCDAYTTDDSATCCQGCPMGGRGCGPIYENDNADPEIIEREVNQWAAEHPEPVYPTWVDWLMEQGIIPDFETAKNSDDPGVRAATFYITKKGFIPIPADIAEKLGVEPKEG